MRISLWPLSTGRFEVVAPFQIAAQVATVTANEALGTLLAADIDVRGDLLHLLTSNLRPDHGGQGPVGCLGGSRLSSEAASP